MTYLAPRQGLFAIIILVGIALHLLFFVISQDHRITQQYRHVLDREVALLAEELSTSLSNKDQVSMSVIAGNYIKNDNIEFVAIYNNQDKLLVFVGQESNQGISSQSMITLDSRVLGSVQIYAPNISRAQIILDNWLFLLATCVLYLLIFFIYSYVARPSKELQQQMTRDIRNELLALEVLATQNHTAEPEPEPSQEAVQQEEQKPSAPKLPINEATDKLRVVKICFEDHHKLLETVDYRSKSTYFALCNQLLDRALLHLLKLPVFAGVSVFAVEYYDEQKAMVILQADNDNAQVALAAAMLAKLMMVLNQIVYDKHRELKRFCLPIRTLVSSFDKQDAIVGVATKYRKSPLLLVDKVDVIQIANHGRLESLPDPTSVDERESRYLSDIKPLMAGKLTTVRDMVLLSDG
ncbi:MAG: hypothetical protein Q4A69_09915 [Moraxella sp.]|nr:hypothetical protein [Moraxella sp.]